MSRHVHLIALGLDSDDPDIPPALRRLFTSCDKTEALARDPLSAFGELLELPGPIDAGLAQCSWQRDFPQAPMPSGLLRADPVHLVADLRELHLSPGACLSLSHEEATLYADAINEYLREDGLRVQIGAEPHRWFLCAEQPFQVQAAPPLTDGHVAVSTLKQTGSDLSRIARIGTELQMLLHNHPLNEVRKEQGAMPLNGLWFWGGGQMRPSATGKAFSLESDASDVLTFAAARGLQVRACGAAYRRQAAGEHLIVIDSLRQLRLAGGHQAFIDCRVQFVENWLRPALRALAMHRISALSVHTSGANYQVNWLNAVKILCTPRKAAEHL